MGTNERLRSERPDTFENHLELVADIARSFASSLDIQDTLRNALHQVMDYLDAEAASIFLLDESGNKLVCRACAGPVEITGTTLRADEGIVGKALRDNSVKMLRDARDSHDFFGSIDDQSGFTTRSILCAPLAVKDQRLGAIELINKKSGDGLFDDRDRDLLTALSSSASLAIRNSAMAQELVEQERLRKELELAAEIQRNLLPASLPPEFPVHGLNIPAREVSGDFYDYFALADGRICFNLADVSGKGINAAMLMAKTSSLFHCVGKEINEPGKLLSILNNELVETSTRGMFVTMIGGVYEPSSGRVQLANAGHQPALFLDRAGSITQIPGQAPPLGILNDFDYPETSLDINGGALYLYTDGVTEARRRDGSGFELTGLGPVLRECAGVPRDRRLRAIADAVLEQVDRFHDDMTMLLIDHEH